MEQAKTRVLNDIAFKTPIWGNDEFLVGKYGLEATFIYLLSEMIDRIDEEKRCKTKMILIALNFMKVYPSIRVAAKEWDLSPDTYQKYISTGLEFLDLALPEENLEERFGKFSHIDLNLVADTTICKVEKPSDKECQRQHFSEKHKHCGLKYEIACRVDNGLCCWINGPYRGGMHDIQIMREGGLLGKIPTTEYMFMDKGYEGLAENVVTPFKGTLLNHFQKTINRDQSSFRQIVENFNSRIKRFAITNHYRGVIVEGMNPSYELHQLIFKVIVRITNMEIKGGKPLCIDA